MKDFDTCRSFFVARCRKILLAGETSCAYTSAEIGKTRYICYIFVRTTYYQRRWIEGKDWKLGTLSFPFHPQFSLFIPSSARQIRTSMSFWWNHPSPVEYPLRWIGVRADGTARRYSCCCWEFHGPCRNLRRSRPTSSSSRLALDASRQSHRPTDPRRTSLLKEVWKKIFKES